MRDTLELHSPVLESGSLPSAIGEHKCAPVAYLKLVNGGWGVVNSDWIVVIVEGPKPAGVGASPITIFRPAVKFMDDTSFTVVGIDCSIFFHYIRDVL